MKIQLTTIFLVSLLLITCNSKKDEAPAYSSRIMKYSDLGPPPGSSSYAAAVSISAKSPLQITPQQRLIIKTASISSEVINYDTAVVLLQRIVNRNNGYVVSSSTRSEEKNKKTGTITVRIPTNTFEEVLADIASISSKVFNRSVSGNDITEEYYDISARLENKRKIEMRYREILKSAKTVAEILSVEKYLGEVREEIENLEGRKRFLNDKVMLSTITISFQEPQAVLAFQREGFWSKILNGFRQGFYGFADVLEYSITFLISAIPAIALLTGLIFTIFRLVKSYRFRKNKT
jgi:Domain of unknown function (DUF4349)